MSDIVTADQQSSAIISAPDRPLATSPGAMLQLIMNAAENDKIDGAKMQMLLNMQLQLEDRQAERNFNAALGRVSRQFPRIPKNGMISLGDDKTGKPRKPVPFATWTDMDRIIRPILDAEGFTLSFDSSVRSGEGGGAIVTGRLLHPDGHSRSASIPLPLDTGPGRNNVQAQGSTLSYGRRYVTEMLLNLVREGQDDDGKAGGTRYITEDQVAEIEALMAETKTRVADFCGTMDTRSLEEIEVSKFPVAMNLLNSKKAQLARKAQQP